MTDLYDALISDSWNRASPKIQAYAYAIKQAIQLVMGMAKQTLCLADVDALPEEVLDQLAIDNRVMYYSNDFDIEKKRTLIKKSLIWYGQAGTVGATKELLDVIFDGNAELIENPDGEAYILFWRTLRRCWGMPRMCVPIFARSNGSLMLIRSCTLRRSHLKL